ncbi:MAG: hypothetical protein AAGI01_04560 [Myxococcota bacterium]
MTAFRDELTDGVTTMARRTLSLALVSALALGSFSCVEADASLLLNGHLPALGEISEDSPQLVNCQTQQNDQIIELAGQIDIAQLGGDEGQPQSGGFRTPGRFQIGLSLVNRLAGNGDTGQGLRLNSNVVQLNQITISSPLLNDDAGGASIDRVRQIGTVIQSDDSRLGTFVDIVQNRTELDQITARLDATFGELQPDGTRVLADTAIVTLPFEIQAFGSTVGQTRVESNILTFPISICKSCLDLNTTPLCVPSM